jgi:hypothetical protein
VWMPGFLPFVTGILLFVGLTWFGSFGEPPLYMAALAFTAYGVHWFAIGLGNGGSDHTQCRRLVAAPGDEYERCVPERSAPRCLCDRIGLLDERRRSAENSLVDAYMRLVRQGYGKDAEPARLASESDRARG